MNFLAYLVAGAFFMEFLDGTIIVTALPAMGRSFGAAAVDLHVGITAYLLTVAVLILPGGWVAERYGARPVFIGAVATFTVGSALCGLANGTEAFVAARVVQGVGGAMMVPVGRLAVLRTTPKEGLMRAIAVLTWPGLSAPLLGPPLGGFLAEHLSWRWIFLVNLPLGVAGILLALRLVPRIAPSERQKPFDWTGFGLGGAVCVCGTLALDMLGHGSDASGGGGGAGLLSAVLLGAAAGGAALLLRRHSRRHPAPLLDPAPLQAATFRLVMFGGTAMRTLVATQPFLLPLLFQLGFGLEPSQAGLLVLALFAGNFGMKPLTSAIMRRWGFRTVMVANGLVQAAAMLGCALLSPTVPVAAVAALLVISGASRSLQFTSLSTLAFADVPERLMGAANTLFSVVFQLSTGIGVAVGAMALRLASVTLGEAGETPSLAAFHWAFAAISALMVMATLTGLRLTADAGAKVSGHRAAAG